MKRSSIRPGRDFLVGAFGLTPGDVFGEAHDTVERRVVAFQSSKVKLGELRRFDIASLDEFCQVRHRKERELFIGRGHRDVDRTRAHRAPSRRKRLSRRDGIENERRRGVVAEAGRPNLGKSVQRTALSVQTLEQPKLFGRREGKTRNLLRRLDHLGRDRGRVFRDRGERSRHQRRAEPNGSKTSNEASTVHRMSHGVPLSKAQSGSLSLTFSANMRAS